MATRKLVEIAQHSSESNEHYTPFEVISAAKNLMGGIDLDPASCEVANNTVAAGDYYDKDDDGLSQKWYGRVFLNPPGGKLRLADGKWVPVVKGQKGQGAFNTHKSSAAVWWSELVRRWIDKEVAEAVFVGFTLEILRSTQHVPALRSALTFPMCFPRERLCFGGATSPTHANVLVYLPPNASSFCIEGFKANFEPLGEIVIPEGWQESAC
jgi:hypothetical protein